MLASRLKQFHDWYNSPRVVAQREKSRREWLAKPWCVRAYIVTRSRLRRYRERLGELIAGREFED